MIHILQTSDIAGNHLQQDLIHPLLHRVQHLRHHTLDPPPGSPIFSHLPDHPQDLLLVHARELGVAAAIGLHVLYSADYAGEAQQLLGLVADDGLQLVGDLAGLLGGLVVQGLQLLRL